MNRTWRTIVLALVPMVLVACSSSSRGDAAPSGLTTATTAGETSTTSPSETTTATTVARPDGPAAEIGAPFSGGRGVSLVSASGAPDLAKVHYEQGEYPASGTAVGYDSAGDLPTDGRFDLKPAGSADYATRIIVRRPKAAADFNGTVIVEWLNVSSGADAAPDFTYMAGELLRGGYAWVGVSAQRIGIEGGPVAVAAPGAELTGAGKGIKNFDAARYGKLHHPGDAYSYDIYTQVARALRSSGSANPLEGLDVRQLLAVGESQSAFTLTTYADGVQPLTHEFDGLLIHSRGGAAAPLGKPDAGIDIAGSIGGGPTRIRTDLDVPVIMVQTETDVLGVLDYLPATQPDTDLIRLWEVAGTAHADYEQIGTVESILGCAKPVNRGQQGYVLRSALRHLKTWAAGGEAPPKAPRLAIDTSAAKPTFVLDEDGNVKGGIRTPAVDASVDVLSGLPVEGASIICVLFGSTTPIPPARLAEKYPDRAAYLADYKKAADSAIKAGFILEEDRKALLAAATPDRIKAS